MNLRTLPIYRNFVNDRNRAAETLLDIYQDKQDKILENLKIRITEIVTTPFYNVQQMGIRIDREFDQASLKFTHVFQELREFSYLLTYAAESEAIARSTGRPVRVRLDRMQLEKPLHKLTPSGGNLHSRILLYLQRLKHKILDAVQLSKTLEENTADTLSRVYSAFPRTHKLSRPKKALPRLKEAMSPTRKPGLVTGIVDDASWQDLVDTLTQDQMRGPKDITTKGGEERYTWEIEQELTQDFISTVRDAQIDAGRNAGIEDFVWVSIVDDKTDECCLWRDGLTTSEIKQRLSTDHRDDECRTEVPPAHFNCRCDVGPVSAGESETVEGLGDFETWLTS